MVGLGRGVLSQYRQVGALSSAPGGRHCSSARTASARAVASGRPDPRVARPRLRGGSAPAAGACTFGGSPAPPPPESGAPPSECARGAHARIAQGGCWRSRHRRPREPGACGDRGLLPRPDRWPVGPRGGQGDRAASPVAISAVPTNGIANSSNDSGAAADRGPEASPRSGGPSHSLRRMTWSVDVAEVLPAAVSPLPGVLAAAVSEAMARPAAQQPAWPDPEEVVRVRGMLEGVPPIAVPAEVDQLQDRLGRSRAARRSCCRAGIARRRSSTTPRRTCAGTIRTLLQMAVVLTYGTSMPVVKVGRIAGQYAKPRSADTDAAGLPSYRGDMVNALEPTPQARRPGSRSACPRVRQRGGGDEPGARDHRRRPGRSAPPARVEHGLRAPLKRRRALRARRHRDRPQPAVHVGLRRR